MRSFTVFILLGLFLASPLAAQDRVTERKTTRDSASGEVTVTESVIVRTTEDITPRNNMLVINPLKFFLFYNLSYFHRLNDVTVIGGGLQIPTPSGISGFGFNLEARFHPSGKALRGFYVAPNISFNRLSEGSNTGEAFSLSLLKVRTNMRAGSPPSASTSAMPGDESPTRREQCFWTQQTRNLHM